MTVHDNVHTTDDYAFGTFALGVFSGGIFPIEQESWTLPSVLLDHFPSTCRHTGLLSPRLGDRELFLEADEVAVDELSGAGKERRGRRLSRSLEPCIGGWGGEHWELAEKKRKFLMCSAKEEYFTVQPTQHIKR